MTTHELRVCFETIKQTLQREKQMRIDVLRNGPLKRRKLREIDEALQALVAIKDFAKLHTAEPAEQARRLGNVDGERGAY